MCQKLNFKNYTLIYEKIVLNRSKGYKERNYIA